MSIEDELLGEFVVEAKEHLSGVERQLLAIEASGDNLDVGLVHEVFRAVHSIKGAAGFLGMTKVNDLAHSFENVLHKVRDRKLKPNPPIVELMLRAADMLERLFDDIHGSNAADISELVAALESIAQGKSLDAPVACDLASIPAVESAASSAPTDSNPTRGADCNRAVAAHENNIRVSVGLLDALANRSGELALRRNELIEALSSDDKDALALIAAQLDQLTNDLQELVLQTRMQPISGLFARFKRVVHDLGASLHKRCELKIEGAQIEVDKTILETIADPLMHLVRNAVDHGIESPHGRTMVGKSPLGQVTLRAFLQPGAVCIEIDDDGAGMDPHQLRREAIARGMLTPAEADQMSDPDALRLIFRAGFSTAAKVSKVSGRGVGLDVVQTNVARLGGAVHVDSALGAGTKFAITLPTAPTVGCPSASPQLGASSPAPSADFASGRSVNSPVVRSSSS